MSSIWEQIKDPNEFLLRETFNAAFSKVFEIIIDSALPDTDNAQLHNEASHFADILFTEYARMATSHRKAFKAIDKKESDYILSASIFDALPFVYDKLKAEGLNDRHAVYIYSKTALYMATEIFYKSTHIRNGYRYEPTHVAERNILSERLLKAQAKGIGGLTLFESMALEFKRIVERHKKNH
jgi:hypothetical protein